MEDLYAPAAHRRRGRGRQVPVTDSPQEGRHYRIQYGQGGLLATAGRAYGVGPGGERLELAQRIANHPQNHHLLVPPKNAYERKFFSRGIVSFQKRFTCDMPQRPAARGEKRCFGIVYIPRRRGRGPVPVPGPIPPAPVGPVVPPAPLTPAIPRELPGARIDPSCFPPGASAADRVRRTNDIRRQVARAIYRLMRAKARLEVLGRISLADRRRFWSGRAERIWFGRYTERGFRKVRRVVRNAHAKLTSADLVIGCKAASGCVIASASQFRPDRLNLTDLWFTYDPGCIKPKARWKQERVQTFIHEAAHLVGVHRKLFPERYMPDNAKNLAKRNPAGARNNADNYAYYVMEVGKA